MIEFILRRSAYSLLIVLGVLLLTFLLFNVGSGDPAGAILGKNATAAEIEGLRRRLGSDLPLFYGHYCRSEAFREVPAGSGVFKRQFAGDDLYAAMPEGMVQVHGEFFKAPPGTLVYRYQSTGFNSQENFSLCLLFQLRRKSCYKGACERYPETGNDGFVSADAAGFFR